MLRRLRVQLDRSAALRYAITSAVALALLAVTNVLVTPFHGVLFSIPIGAAALATYGVGAGPAALLSLVVGLGLWYGVLEPRYSFAVTRMDDLDHVIAYFVTCAIVIWTMRRMRRTQRRLATAKRETEEALLLQRQTSERVRALSEAMPQVVFALAPDGSAEYVNDFWTRFSGLDIEETRRAGWPGFIHADDLAGVRETWREARALSAPRSAELRYRAKDGSYRWFLATIAPLEPDDPRGSWIGTATDIHDRKLAEGALRASEERYRRLFESMDEGFALHEMVYDERTGAPIDYRFLEVNPAFGRLTGLEPSRVVGRTAREAIPGLEPTWIATYARVAATGNPERFQAQESALGRWYECFAFRTGAGRFGAAFTDISARKRAEAELRAREREYRMLAENSPEAIARFDRQLRHTYVNEYGAKVHGRSRDEVVGRTMAELQMPEHTVASWTERLQEVFATGAQQTLEFEFEGSSFGHLLFSSLFVPEFDEERQVVSVLAITRDVTMLRKAEQAMRESEKRFRELANNFAQLAWMTDETGAAFWYNERWYEYTGTSFEEVQGRGWQTVQHPDHLSRVVEKFSDCVRRGALWEDTFPLRGRDGRYRWFLSRAIPIRDESGRVIRWFGTNTDVTDLREAEQALREANERLEQTDRNKNEFLGVLSHELRNPLAPIRNSIYVLEKAAPGSSQAGRARRVIDRQVHQMTRLIDDLLDVTRISRGKVSLHREPLELNELVRRTAEDHLSVFTQSGVELAVSLAPDPLYVDGDRTRLAQIVGNLLQNAAKFTPKGGHAGIEVGRDAAEHVTVHVRDDGPGLAPAVLARLFEPFVQAEMTLDRTRGGLGLGLALVKGLAELHGGAVSAHSEGAGKGAEFVVRLPLVSAAAARPAASAQARGRCRGHRVLVIDDNADTAESLKEALELGSHLVETAADAEEGLAKARRFQPEIVLCDIGLPGTDGYELARRMRADPELRKVHLVAVSGYMRPEDVQRSREAGFEDHLPKPTPLETLEQRIEDVTS